jgi:L-iditol 2-dehydrogenase
MRAARLHGVRDLRVEHLPVPVAGPGELLVRVEACGVCPTDLRKYQIGTRDPLPLNPGHEWVGHVQDVGPGVSGFGPGSRVYGDTYAGYAQYAVLAVAPGAWSNGALEVPDAIPADEAVFVEPLADCLHAVHDQARVAAGDRVTVVGTGQMGLQIVAAAARAGGRVLAVDPRPERRELAVALGAERAVGPDRFADEAAASDAVILTLGRADLVPACTAVAAPGGRVVLFAGFGDQPHATLDLNDLHYREVSVVGSEWIGTPPHQRRHRYDEALALIAAGDIAVARLVSGRCALDGLEEAFRAIADGRALKVVLDPWAGA